MNEVRRLPSLSRRCLLRHAALGAGAAIVAPGIFAKEASAAKMSQKAAAYQDKPKGEQRCDNCTLFQAPAACKLVDGNISPEGWCKLYVLKPSG